MVNFPGYVSQWHANVLCISYMAQEANIWLTQTMSRYSHYWPGHLQYSHCYTEVVMWATGAQKGGEGQREKKERKTSHGISIYCPFQPTPYSIQQHLMSEIFHIKDSQHGRSRADVCLRCQWKKKKVAKYVLMES